MREFWRQTAPHSSDRACSMFCVSDVPVVWCWVARKDGYIWLENIWSTQEGNGYGSKALDWFCTLADEFGVEIRGDIQPPHGGRLDYEELSAWYQRRGFSVDGREMCREPKIRSEEHTSELQSRFDLVCRLLLEKKKKKIQRMQLQL